MTSLVIAAGNSTRSQQPSSSQHPTRTQPSQLTRPAQTPPSPSPQPTPPPAPKTPGTTPSSSSVASPTASPPRQPTKIPVAAPSPPATPSSAPSLPGASPSPSNTPSPVLAPSPPPVPLTAQTNQNLNLLRLDQALRLANLQSSSYQQAAINERIAAEDVRQAQAAFLPRLSSPIVYTYTSPSPLLGAPPGTPREQSFIANNAINEYQALVNVAGDIDIAGRLRATLAKNRALLAAAHVGTEVARRALVQAVIVAYYDLALAIAQSLAAEQNLAAAEQFEKITSLLLSGGEVAPVDLTRAQLQTITRRDELERTRANEAVAAGALRVLVGYDFSKPLTTTDLAMAIPVDSEVQRFTADTISQRPEFAQFEAERRAAEQEVRLARAERRPQLSYSINGGFDTNSLKYPNLTNHSGVSAAFDLSIPIFDWGASKSRERQARLRAQIAENARTQALRGFAQQFYAAQAQAISAAMRIRLAGTGVSQAQINLEASIRRYRAGEAQIIEVTDAQTTLVAQKSALYQAIFDYQTALARLRQAAGR
jgi:outer membrane protein TolC